MSNPIDYGGLPTSFDFVRVYDPNVSTPIDGSKQSLRDPSSGSPFTIEILLPEVLLDAFQGGRVTQPTGIFDPLLEEVNQAAVLAGDSQLGTRVPQNVEIGLIDSVLRSTNNFGPVRDKQERFRQNSFFSTSLDGLTNLERIVYGNGYTSNGSNTLVTTVNQVALSDLNSALSVILQVNRILRTPKLEFLINPSSWTISYTKKQEWQDITRTGYVFQAWGEEQGKISASGRIGSFFAGASGSEAGMTFSPSGAQWASRKDSPAFQFLMNLLTFYQNNAYVYDLLEASHNTTWIGDIKISYDQKVYLGSFEDFSWTYEEGQPNGGITYNFNFIISREFDTQSPGPIGVIGSASGASAINPLTNTISGNVTSSASSEALFAGL